MTKAYKATYEYKCIDQFYEIGKEYKLEYKPSLCERGFHYCLNAENTLDYYIPNQSFKLLEIEDLNPNDTVQGRNKSCSNHIKIVREITDSRELMELLGNKVYVYKNRIIYYKDNYGMKYYNKGLLCFLFAMWHDFKSLF